MLDTVILIDDSDADLLYTRLVLERSGAAARVLAFEDAREALRQLATSQVHADVILLDINMPGMNGFAFLQAYGELWRTLADAPVVVMLTSSPDPDDRQRSMAHACVCGYVTKPIDKASALDLVQMVARQVP